MSERERQFTLCDGKLTLVADVPEVPIRACVSRGGVLHLQRPYAMASVCGRQTTAGAARREIRQVLSLEGNRARKVCPYCLAWAQLDGSKNRATEGEGNEQ